MATLLISIVGSPGVGKSTLCSALARRYDQAGVTVDHFAEEHILTRPAFAAVAAEFADGAGSVRPATLINATEQYIRDAETQGTAMLITDALIPFIPSLVAWGHDETEIIRIARELDHAVRPSEVIIVQIIDDPAVTLARAAEREGPQWLDWYVGKLAAAPGTRHVVDLDSAIAHLRQEIELTRRVLRQTGWRVIELEADQRTPEQLVESVAEQLPSSDAIADTGG